MKLFKYLSLCSIGYVFCHTLIFLMVMMNRNLFAIVQYHHSDSLLWYLIYFIFPSFISLLLGAFLYPKINVLKRQKEVMVVCGINFVLLVIVNLLIVSISFAYWGYAFKRPAIFSKVKSAYKIVNASEVYSEDMDGRKILNIKETKRQDEDLYGRRDPYYGNNDRIFMTFQDNALFELYEVLLDTNKDISRESLNSISQIIYAIDIIEPGEKNWDTTRNVAGTIVEFITKNNSKYYYAGLSGGQVANDHFPFYEFLFCVKEGKVFLYKKHKFFTDVAGIEGAEYSAIEPFFMTNLFILLFILFSVLMYIERIDRKK